MSNDLTSDPHVFVSLTPPVTSTNTRLSITVKSNAGGLLITPHGDLDQDTASMFTDCLDAALAAQCRPLLIDLSEVSFLDVAGYRAIGRIAQRCRRSDVIITWLHPSSPVRTLFRILGPPTDFAERTTS